MSRPKGSKNKKTISKLDNTEPIIKRGRGRPKKIIAEALSQNVEIVNEPIININEKEIKQEIRALRKLKLQCRAGTAERISLGRQIKDLKNKLIGYNQPEPEKEPIIAEILKIEAEQNIKPTFEVLGISLYKYSLEQLNKHLECIKRKRGIK